MYYQESDTLLAKGNFPREDIEKFDAFLFKNQNRAVRANRIADFLGADIDLTVDVLEAYAKNGAVTKRRKAICHMDDAVIEDEGDDTFTCDNCDKSYSADEVTFEEVYFPKTLDLPSPVEEPSNDNYGIARDDYEHVIVMVHGIRDVGAWQRTVSNALQAPKTEVIQFRFGLYPAIRFLFPFNLSGTAVRKVVEKFRDVKAEYPNAKISVIAHSFGTYVVLKALEQDPNLRLWKMVFCGSVANDQIRWVRFKNRIGDGVRPTRDFVVNDCGTGDFWPVFGAAFGWHYGMAGATGFSEEMVLNRFHQGTNRKAGHHSLYFNPDFVKKYWKPFLIADESPLQGNGTQGEHLGVFAKSLYHGWLRWICRLFALLVWLALIAAIPVAAFLVYRCF
jgi:pimeloyl-ACP methyl ester carboxylesterase